uniref:Putative monolaris n=1 Tax=Rhipicephalus pulchellus TaxID=72859 RepID=L7LSI8_RHIPC
MMASRLFIWLVCFIELGVYGPAETTTVNGRAASRRRRIPTLCSHPSVPAPHCSPPHEFVYHYSFNTTTQVCEKYRQCSWVSGFLSRKECYSKCGHNSPCLKQSEMDLSFLELTWFRYNHHNDKCEARTDNKMPWDEWPAENGFFNEEDCIKACQPNRTITYI